MTKIFAAKQEGPQTEKLPSWPVLVLVSRDTIMVKVNGVTEWLSPSTTISFSHQPTISWGGRQRQPPRKWVSAPEFPPHLLDISSLFRMQLKHAYNGLAEPLASRMALFCWSFLHFMGCIGAQTAPGINAWKQSLPCERPGWFKLVKAGWSKLRTLSLLHVRLEQARCSS